MFKEESEEHIISLYPAMIPLENLGVMLSALRTVMTFLSYTVV